MRPLALALALLVGCVGSRTPCAAHDECSDDQFCGVEGVCLDAFGRNYRFVMVGAEVGDTRPDGSAWDGDPPSLFLRFGFVDSQDPCHTSVDAAYAPTWNEFCVFELRSGDTFGLELWETTPASEVLVAGWAWPTDEDLVSLTRELDEAVLVTDLTGTVDVAYAVERVR